MVEKLFNDPHLLHQRSNPDMMPEQPIAICVDNTPIIILSQEGRHICLNFESVPELSKLLWRLRKEQRRQNDV